MRSSSSSIALVAAAFVAALGGGARDAHAGENAAIMQFEANSTFDFGVIDTLGIVFQTGIGWDRWELRGGVGLFDYNDGYGPGASDLGLDTTRLDAHVRYNLLQTRCHDCGKLTLRASNWIEAGVGRKHVALYDRQGTPFGKNVIEDGARPELSVGVGAGIAMRGAIGVSIATRWNIAPATHAEEMLLGGGPVSSYMLMLGISLNPL